MAFEQTIDCPDCGTPIPYDAKRLLLGEAFVCPNDACAASIALSPGRGAQWTSAAKAFETLKTTAFTTKEYDR